MSSLEVMFSILQRREGARLSITVNHNQDTKVQYQYTVMLKNGTEQILEEMFSLALFTEVEWIYETSCQ